MNWFFVRHVGAHPVEHQHSVSIQISISLGKTFLRISRIRNIPLTWILARVFVYVPPFISRFWTLSIERFLFLFWSILNGVTLKSSYIMLMNCSIDNSNHVLNAKKVEKKKQCTGPRNIEFQWISHIICLSVVGWFWLSQNVKQLYFSKK